MLYNLFNFQIMILNEIYCTKNNLRKILRLGTQYSANLTRQEQVLYWLVRCQFDGKVSRQRARAAVAWFIVYGTQIN